MKFLLIGLIRFYQYAISPLIGPRCACHRTAKPGK